MEEERLEDGEEATTIDSDKDSSFFSLLVLCGDRREARQIASVVCMATADCFWLLLDTTTYCYFYAIA